MSVIPVNDLIREAKTGSLESFEELVLLYQDRFSPTVSTWL